MSLAKNETTQLVARLRAGDESARDPLIEQTIDRLRQIASQMLRRFPGVRRWEETDDVLQIGVIRLCAALKDVRLESSLHYYRLATLQFRRVLVDLARKYMSSHGFGSKHHTDRLNPTASGGGGLIDRQIDKSIEPDSYERLMILDDAVETLPIEERDVVYLLHYHGLTQEEAALALDISIRTVRRRWQSARIKLHKALKDSEDAP